MKGKRLLILGAALALGLSACANSATLVRKNPFRTQSTGILSSGVYDSSAKTITWSNEYLTIVQSTGTGQTAPNSSYLTAPRWYTGNIVTFTPADNYSIDSVQITSNTTSYATVLAESNYTNASASANDTKVTITPINGSEVFSVSIGGQTRLSALVFEYSSIGGSSSSSDPSSGSSEGTQDENLTFSFDYSDIPDGFTATTGTAGDFDVISGEDNLTINYSGINTKSSATASDHSYGYAMFLKNYGYIYSNNAPAGYYPTSVKVTIGSGSGESGKIGCSFGSSALNSRNSSVSGSVKKGETYTYNNHDSSKSYWNFSTTGANVQIDSFVITYSLAPQAGSYYTVTFNTNGGSEIDPQTIPNDGSSKPSIPNPAPTKNGYVFAGWYSDEELTEAFNFNAPVTADVTAYANWIKMPLSETYSVSTLTNDTYYRISGEVTAIAGSSLFFIQDGNNSMQIYNGALAAQVSVGNTVDLCGKYVSNYSEITDLVYYEITSTDTTNSQVPLTSLNDATVANQFKYFEISKLQLGSAFSSNKASILGNDTVTVYFKYADHVNSGSFNASDYAANDYVSVKGIINIYNSLPQLQIVEISKLEQCVVTFNLNGMAGASEVPSQTVLEGEKAQQPSNPSKQPDENYSYEFIGWYTDDSCEDQYAYDFNSSVLEDLTLYAKWNTTERSAADVIESTATYTSLSYNYDKLGGSTDVLNKEFTGRTGSTYDTWNDKVGTSGIVYAGQSAADNDSIQLRSNNSNSGVIVTSNETVHTAKKVTVVWESHTANGRTIDIYGSDVAYEAASDLYDGEKQGTKLGSIVCGTSTELVIDEEYNFKYIGIRSASGALYLSSISIQWGELPSFTYNAAVRFGGLLSKTLWDKLDTDEHLITGYGLLIATADFLDGDQLKDYFDTADNVYVKKYETNGKTPTLVDGKYGWNLFKRLGNDELKVQFTSVAFIKLGDQVVFFDEVTASAKSLANDLINADNEYSRDSFEGSLGYLADLH